MSKKKESDANAKLNTLNNFNCSDLPQHPAISSSSSISSELPLVIKKRGLYPTIANRTPRDFFFIRILGEGSFSTVSNFFFCNFVFHFLYKVKKEINK